MAWLRLLLTVAAVALVAACAQQGRETASPLTVAPPPTASPASTPAPPGQVTLAAVGDVMLGRGIATLIRERGPRYPWAEVAAVLREADITFANLEAPLTAVGSAQAKDFVFRAEPDSAQGLVWAGIDVVSLANNHTLDYGSEGLLATLEALRSVGVAYTGAGADGAAAHNPVVLTAKGLRVAFLAYVNVPDDSVSGFSTRRVAAGPATQGVAWGTAAAIRSDVARAREMADIVVVSLHSGYEYQEGPNQVQAELARAAVEAGAQLVLGHHPHVLQGLERRGGALIAYSLGNFIFDLDATDYAQPGLPSTLSAILRVTLSREGVVDYQVVPVRINPDDGRPLLVEGEAARPVLERIERLSALLNRSGP